MLKLKSQLTCLCCSKIYKDPILLPCDDSICREHLSEKNVVKENKIICKKCNTEFEVKGNEFKSSIVLTKLTESQSYLSEEESSLKQELEGSVRQFFEIYDEFVPKKAKIELDVFEHFQEIRFQIDQHREELIEKSMSIANDPDRLLAIHKKIDDIALEMIDQTKTNENTCLKNLNEYFFSFDDIKTLDSELNQIEDIFRNPNLLIKTIKEMRRKKEESLYDIQSKLNEMNQIKDDLKERNQFKPNLSSLNQEEETPLFGSIKLNGYWFNVNLFKSQILTVDRLTSELIKLCDFSPNDKWTLLYRGTRDGFGSRVFHSKCDGHSNTLTLLKAKQSSCIFGGFTSVSWDGTSGYKSDSDAFIFSLSNKDNFPLIININPDRPDNAIYCHSRYGPTFGEGHDLCIANNANTTKDSYSQLGFTYEHPFFDLDRFEGEPIQEENKFLAGSTHFQLDEIEVFQKE